VKRSAFALLLLATLASGCSVVEFPTQVRGNKVTEDQLKDLVPGTSTRADVTSVLGSPTAKGTFDDNTWIYISEVTQPRIGRVQGVNSQEVVALGFDDHGVLRTVKQMSQKDSQSVDVVARATPSPGSEASFMQQLLGNVGRFNAGPAAASGSKASGSNPQP
jgi:outer membrane protein assembly factor BamE (lipoprotein component of BamABCDE complex)